MASATGIPQTDPTTIDSQESAPLLGQPGDATQRQGDSIGRNLISGESDSGETLSAVTDHITGTASVAQAGVWVVSTNTRVAWRSSDN